MPFEIRVIFGGVGRYIKSFGRETFEVFIQTHIKSNRTCEDRLSFAAKPLIKA